MLITSHEHWTHRFWRKSDYNNRNNTDIFDGNILPILSYFALFMTGKTFFPRESAFRIYILVKKYYSKGCCIHATQVMLLFNFVRFCTRKERLNGMQYYQANQ